MDGHFENLLKLIIGDNPSARAKVIVSKFIHTGTKISEFSIQIYNNNNNNSHGLLNKADAELAKYGKIMRRRIFVFLISAE